MKIICKAAWALLALPVVQSDDCVDFNSGTNAQNDAMDLNEPYYGVCEDSAGKRHECPNLCGIQSTGKSILRTPALPDCTQCSKAIDLGLAYTYNDGVCMNDWGTGDPTCSGSRLITDCSNCKKFPLISLSETKCLLENCSSNACHGYELDVSQTILGIGMVYYENDPPVVINNILYKSLTLPTAGGCQLTMLSTNLFCELLQLDNGQDSSIVKRGGTTSGTYGLIFQKQSSGDYQLTLPMTNIHTVSWNLQVYCYWQDPNWSYWRDVSNKFSLEVKQCTPLTTEIVSSITTQVTSYDNKFVVPVPAGFTIDSAIQPKYTGGCTQLISCEVRMYSTSDCLNTIYPDATCAVTPGTLATTITFNGTIDHVNKDLMLRFYMTPNELTTSVCSSEVLATQAVFNLNHIQYCKLLTTEIVSPITTQVTSYNATFAVPVASITIDSAIQPKYADAFCAENINCEVRQYSTSTNYTGATCTVTPLTLATTITFDGTIEHVSENLMLTFYCDSNPSTTLVSSSSISAAFTLNYVHVGCTNINMPNDTKTFLQKNGLPNPQQVRPLVDFFQASDCQVHHTELTVTRWDVQTNEPNWAILNQTTHANFAPTFNLASNDAFKFDFMLRSYRTWYVSTNHMLVVWGNKPFCTPATFNWTLPIPTLEQLSTGNLEQNFQYYLDPITTNCKPRISSTFQFVQSGTLLAVDELYYVGANAFFGIMSVNSAGVTSFNLKTLPSYHNKNFTVVTDLTLHLWLLGEPYTWTQTTTQICNHLITVNSTHYPRQVNFYPSMLKHNLQIEGFSFDSDCVIHGYDVTNHATATNLTTTWTYPSPSCTAGLFCDYVELDISQQGQMILEVTPQIHLPNLVLPQMITVDVACPAAPHPNLQLMYSANSLFHSVLQFTQVNLTITIDEFSVKQSDCQTIVSYEVLDNNNGQGIAVPHVTPGCATQPCTVVIVDKEAFQTFQDYTFYICAKDNNGLSQFSSQITVHVIEVIPNLSVPTMKQPEDVQMYVNETLVIELPSIVDLDPVDNPVFSQVIFDEKAEDFMHFDNNTGELNIPGSTYIIFIDPKSDKSLAGVYTISILLDDLRGSFNDYSFKVTVKELSETPVFVSPILETVIVQELEEETIQEEEAKKAEEPAQKEVKTAPKTSQVTIKEQLDSSWEFSEDDMKKEEGRVPEVDATALPVRLRATKFDRKGMVTISFNQKLLVPYFVQPKATQNATRRQLEEATENQKEDIEFEADILKVFLSIRDEPEPEELKTSFGFVPTMLNWTEEFLVVHVNFSKPEELSRSFLPDQIYFKVVNPWMFTSLQGQRPESQIQSLIMPVDIPVQLPRGVDEDALDDLAKKAMTVIVIIQLVMALIIKSAISRMWRIFFYLQVVIAFQVLHISLPANLGILYDNFKMIIFFEILKPENILPLLGIKMTLEEILGMDHATLVLEGEEVISTISENDRQINSIKNLRIYLIGFSIGFCVLLLVSFVGLLIKGIRTKIFKLVKTTLRGFFWNNSIQAIYIAFLPQLILSVKAFSLSVLFEQQDDGYAMNLIQISVLGIIPFVATYWLLKNKNRLRGSKELAQKYESLYLGVKLPWKNINNNAVLFYPLFLFRRLLFIWVPFIFHGYSSFQALITIVMFLAYTAWILHTRPIQNRRTQQILVLNESSLLLSGYFSLYFSLKPEVNAAFLLGYVQIVQVIIVVLVNIFQIFVDLHMEKKLAAKLDKKLKKKKAKDLEKSEKKREKQRLDMENAEQKPAENKELKPVPETVQKRKTAPKPKPKSVKPPPPVYKAVINVMSLQVTEEEQKPPPKPPRKRKMPSYHMWKIKEEPEEETVREKIVEKKPIKEPVLPKFKIIPASQVTYPGGQKPNPKSFLEMIKTENTEIDTENLCADALLPSDPSHFDVYPCILAKHQQMRLKHKMIIEDLDSRSPYSTNTIEQYKYEQEKSQRDLLRTFQQRKNRQLLVMILKVRPNFQHQTMVKRILDGKSCSQESLEFEIALTLASLSYINNSIINEVKT